MEQEAPECGLQGDLSGEIQQRVHTGASAAAATALSSTRGMQSPPPWQGPPSGTGAFSSEVTRCKGLVRAHLAAAPEAKTPRPQAAPGQVAAQGCPLGWGKRGLADNRMDSKQGSVPQAAQDSLAGSPEARSHRPSAEGLLLDNGPAEGH